MIEHQDPLELSQLTANDVSTVDEQEYNKAKDLVKKELDTMKVTKIHPKVYREYIESSDSNNGGIARKESIFLKDLKKMSAKLGKNEQFDVASLKGIDLSKYTNFKSKDESQVYDFEKLYTSLAHQRHRYDKE